MARDTGPRPAPGRSQPERSPAVFVGLGGGVLHSTGGLGANVVVAPGLTFAFVPTAGMRLGVAVPATAPAIEAREGNASVSPTSFSTSGWFSPLQSSWATPYLEGGLSLVFLSIAAQAAPGYEAQDKTVATALPFAGLGVSLLPGRTHLRLGGTTGPGLRSENVLFAGNKVARWGGWVSQATLAVDVGID